MLIGGLWHGASWMYVIWGGLQGLFLVGHKELKKSLPRPSKSTWWRVAANVFITFNLVAISFMFFRASSMETVKEMTTQIFTNFHLEVAPQFVSGYLTIVLIMTGAYLMHFAPEKWTAWLKGKFGGLHPVLQTIVLAIVLFLIIQMRQTDIVPFIYLQY